MSKIGIKTNNVQVIPRQEVRMVQLMCQSNSIGVCVCVFGVTRGRRFRDRSTLLLLPLELCHDKDMVVYTIHTLHTHSQQQFYQRVYVCAYLTQVEAGQIQSKWRRPALWLTTSHLPEIILIIHREEEEEGSGRAEEFAL